MFESLEVGKQIKNKAFNEQSLALRQQLLAAQIELQTLDFPVIIVVAGLDGAGKGSVVHRLNEWMDPRGIESHAFWEPSDEEESRPFYWRFWRRLPDKGKIGIFFGSWYTPLMQKEFWNKSDSSEFSTHCHNILEFEKMLSDDGALIIKLWFHISRETQYMQLSQDAPRKKQNLRVPVDAEQARKNYKKTLNIAENLILDTDSNHSPWHLIEAEDNNYRDLTAGQVILAALQSRAKTSTLPPGASAENVNTNDKQPTVLDTVDLSQTLSSGDYKNQLREYQTRLQDLAWQFHAQGRSVIAVFEGWDAAGKGSAIRRVTNAFDPRLYKLVQFASPTDEERRHHYLWRFWRHLERDGHNTFFDRSWYGRVLVERVEQYAKPDEWGRAYAEINRFEQQLSDHGAVVLKFWIHIGREEQLQRFKQRELEPHKKHKITEEDWRNREKWEDYEHAVDEMVSRTSTHHAPWTLVAGNNKRFARIQVLKTFCQRMQDAVEA